VRSLPSGATALIQGASGGIGSALVSQLLQHEHVERVYAATRSPGAEQLAALSGQDPRLTIVPLDLEDSASVADAASMVAAETNRCDLIVNCAGLLHDEGTGMAPERRLSAVRAADMERAFRVNAIGSLLVAQAFESMLRRAPAPVFAAISARVGSITDNRLGGWYAYRASKAALNMGLRTLAIEWGRGSPPIRVFALHPGTVSTGLSAPFTRRNTGPKKVFSPEQAATQLLDVLDGAGPAATGIFLDWQGRPIPW